MEVELEMCFRWDCPKCGTQNITSAVPLEGNDEVIAEMAKANDVPEDLMREEMDAGLVSTPTRVVCCCGERFNVKRDFEPES